MDWWCKNQICIRWIKSVTFVLSIDHFSNVSSSTIQQFCLILQYIINFARKMVFVLFLSKTKSVTFASWAEKCLYSFPQFSHKHKPLFCKCLVFSKLMKVLLKIPLIKVVVFQLRKIGLQTKFRKFGFHSYLQAISIIIIWRNDLRIR